MATLAYWGPVYRPIVQTEDCNLRRRDANGRRVGQCC